MRYRKLAIRLLFVLVAFITLVAVAYLIEDLRGRRAWERYSRETRDRGEKLDLPEFIAPPVPEADNFAAIPFFQDMFAAAVARRDLPKVVSFPKPEIERPTLGDVFKGDKRSLRDWRDYFVKVGLISSASEDVPGDVLRALEHYKAPLDQVHEAASRPFSRFPVKWEDGFAAQVPHLGEIRQLATLLSLKMAAHLGRGDSPGAYADFQDGLRLYQALRGEALLITGVVRVAVLAVFEQAVLEGVAEDQWKDAELQQLTADFGKLRLLEDYKFALKSERGGMNSQLDALLRMSAKQRAKLFDVVQVGTTGQVPSATNLAGLAYPRGWIRQNQVVINRLFDQQLAEIDKVEQRGRTSGSVDDAITKMVTGSLIRSYYYALVNMIMPAIGNVQSSYLLADVRTNQVATACALQRFKHVRGAYPAKLDELSPEFLPAPPRDVITATPMRYRTDGANHYSLWSVALNGKDENATRNPKKGSRDQPDWVWSVE